MRRRSSWALSYDDYWVWRSALAKTSELVISRHRPVAEQGPLIPRKRTPQAILRIEGRTARVRRD
jgi:hypothetical protein